MANIADIQSRDPFISWEETIIFRLHNLDKHITHQIVRRFVLY